jgi:hypothetical protein
VALLAAAMTVVAVVIPSAVAGAARRDAVPTRGPGARAEAGPVGSYVALGDSYTSGPLVPDQVGRPPGCHRSDHDYPALVARALGLRLDDVSCSGAEAADMTSPQTTSDGVNPPQLSALGRATTLVTLGVGGDDLGVTSVIEHCLAATPWGPTISGRTCRAHYDPGGQDSLAAAVQSVGAKVAGVLARIHRLAPRATVLVVGYPAIVPSTGDGCWPSMPFTRTDAPYLGQTERELDAMLATVSADGGARYVDTYTPSEAHTACAPASVRWIEPIVPATAAFPVHPNARGETAMAALVLAALGRSSPPAAGPAPRVGTSRVVLPAPPRPLTR